MTEGSLITDELKKFIGRSMDPIIYRVEEGSIQRYADAMCDPNPLFSDIGYANKSRWGKLICPPGFFGWPAKLGYDPLALPNKLIEAGAPPNGLDGGIELEFFEPIGAGDILTCVTSVADFSERSSKAGKMLIATVLIKYLNQNGDLVAEVRLTWLYR